jgi:hypothetical protein
VPTSVARRKYCRKHLPDHSEYLPSPQLFFELLPARPVATTKSDSDGKFTMELPRPGEMVLGATTDRKLLKSTEHYYWMVKVTPEAETSITLSNDNLADSGSPQSLIHAERDFGVRAESSPPMRAFDCQTVNDLAASHRRFLHMRWLTFAIYLAVGVALWRSWPWFRNTFHEAGYAGGMILTALIWPLALMMVAGIMVFFLVGWLLEKLFRLFRHKQ